MLEDAIDTIATTPLRDLAPPQHYRPITAGTPHLVILRLPSMFRRAGYVSSINDRHKVIVTETAHELQEVELALDQPLRVKTRGDQTVVDFKATIDKVSARASKRPVGDFMILDYAPPEPGWPHVVVTALPVNIPGQGFFRERYGFQLFADEDGALEHICTLSGMVGLAGLELNVEVAS